MIAEPEQSTAEGTNAAEKKDDAVPPSQLTAEGTNAAENYDAPPPLSRVDVHDCSGQLSPHSWPLPWLPDGFCRFGRSPAISKDCEDSPATAAIEDRSQVLPMVASEHCDDAHVHTAPPAIVAMEVPIAHGPVTPCDTACRSSC